MFSNAGSNPLRSNHLGEMCPVVEFTETLARPMLENSNETREEIKE
jgi:hypothetical protein